MRTRVVTVEGGPRERGRQHGETLRAEIREFNRRWFDWIGPARGRPPGAYLRSFVERSGHLAAAERRAPGLLDEVRGTAEGAGVPFAVMFAAQLHDEEWASALRTDGARCSAFVAHDAEPCPLAGQNMDVPAWFDGFQFVLRAREAGRETAVLAYPGSLGMCGMNNRSVAVCCNTLFDLASASDGVPVLFMLRMLLERDTAASASALARAAPHASGQSYLVADPVGFTLLECSARSAAAVPTSGAARAGHTNHVLASADFAPGRPGASGTSQGRLSRIAERLGRPGPFGLEAAKALLASREDPGCPLSREIVSAGAPDALIGFTYGSVICELGERPVLHAAAGPPSLAPFEEVVLLPRPEAASG